jgi:uncharacterized protein (DUF2345 family)
VQANTISRLQAQNRDTSQTRAAHWRKAENSLVCNRKVNWIQASQPVIAMASEPDIVLASEPDIALASECCEGDLGRETGERLS